MMILKLRARRDRRTLSLVALTLAVMMTGAELHASVPATAGVKPRARELGIPFEGQPGKWNAITDVKGVEVGEVSVVRGEGKLTIGKGPVRTGVTVIHPRGKATTDQVLAGWFSQNGNGEMTGTTWVDESGFLEGPIAITNTHSVGVVRDTIVSWRVREGKPDSAISLPVVAETWDGYLNDINGFHIKPEHVLQALDRAKSGPVAEGNTGGGTGMICFEFKCGTGTSSRVVHTKAGDYTVGVLVQANFGLRRHLRIAGIPMGDLPGSLVWTKETGSIIAVIATDAPLLPHQLKRLARRASMGIARMGAVSGDSSGDIFIAFSTANAEAQPDKAISKLTMLANEQMDPLFEATVQSVEESVMNAMVAAQTMTGVDGHKAVAVPIEKVQAILKDHKLLVPPPPKS